MTLLAPGSYSVANNSKAERDSGFVRRNGLSLSVNGLTDLSNKFYYDALIQSDGGRSVPGIGRTVLATADYKF